MIQFDWEQYSPEWWKLHNGKITASNFAKIITATGKPSRSIGTYLFEVAGKSLLTSAVDEYSNEWMERGLELESEARDVYKQITGKAVQEVGFIQKSPGSLIGCSPDGLIGDEGGLEIKCPKIGTHAKTMYSTKIPTKYIPQVQGSLWITGRKWWDFMSYYPDLPPVILRMFPNKKYQEALAQEMGKAEKKLRAIIKTIKNKIN